VGLSNGFGSYGLRTSVRDGRSLLNTFPFDAASGGGHDHHEHNHHQHHQSDDDSR